MSSDSIDVMNPSTLRPTVHAEKSVKKARDFLGSDLRAERVLSHAHRSRSAVHRRHGASNDTLGFSGVAVGRTIP
jgi:hypothetical protein